MLDGGGGGGDFRGINPDRLGDLISSINSHSGDGARAGGPHVNSWTSQARRLRLDTSRLSKMTRHLSWAQGELPMLRRRHSLAMNEEKINKEHGITGMVSAGAGDIGAYTTQQAAQKAGGDDAEAFKDGDLSLEEYMKRLAANQTDPDYCSAAMDALGPEALYRLQDGPVMYDPENPDNGMRVLASTVATAMRNGTHFKDDYGNEDIQHLAPLLAFADFPSDVIANLGGQSLAPGNYMYGEKVWEAMADDPRAAEKFLHENMEIIPLWMKGDSDHHGGMIDDQAEAFADVIRAGTLDMPGSDPGMAADNTEQLIQFYADHPDDHTHSEIQRAYADMITGHWDDVQAILTDPAPADGGSGHVFVSEKAMRAFIDESMRNADSTTLLMAFSKQQALDLARSDPDNRQVLHSKGLIDDIFSEEAQRTYSALKQESEDDAKRWNATVSSQLQTAFGVGIDVLFTPQDYAKTLTKAAIKDAFNLFTSDINAVEANGGPKEPDYATWRTEWQDAASLVYADDPTLGHPDQYADQYCDGKDFLGPDGHLVDGASREQEQAYNAWLKDKDLQSKAYPKFDDMNDGRQDGHQVGG